MHFRVIFLPSRLEKLEFIQIVTVTNSKSCARHFPACQTENIVLLINNSASIRCYSFCRSGNKCLNSSRNPKNIIKYRVSQLIKTNWKILYKYEAFCIADFQKLSLFFCTSSHACNVRFAKKRAANQSEHNSVDCLFVACTDKTFRYGRANRERANTASKRATVRHVTTQLRYFLLTYFLMQFFQSQVQNRPGFVGHARHLGLINFVSFSDMAARGFRFSGGIGSASDRL